MKFLRLREIIIDTVARVKEYSKEILVTWNDENPNHTNKYKERQANANIHIIIDKDSPVKLNYPGPPTFVAVNLMCKGIDNYLQQIINDEKALRTLDSAAHSYWKYSFRSFIELGSLIY